MIRITHLSGSLQGKTSTSAKPTLRVGRASDCDVRFDKQRDPKVSNHHAEFLLEDGCWFVVDTASTNGTLVEGRRVAKHRLRQGKEVQRFTRTKTARRWVKVVAVVAAVAAMVVAAMAVVIARQKRQIEELVTQKERLDRDIEAVQQQMNEESDPERLAALEERLNTLTGNARNTLAALGKSDKGKAAALAESGDEIDRQIRDILRKFDADTYAVPPIFKERLKFHIDELTKAPNLKFVYRRKQRYWGMISREFNALGLPEEMAYVAWAETQFDPKAKSSAGAAGMWQMMPTTAHNYGLRVDAKVDERYDADRETRAAARHLANLLAEYGSDSFMLAMASYNRGETGVRRVLHQIAQEPGGFRKEKRDFWHLYRMKKLPEETREYVPKVLAAAIVSRQAKKLGLEEAD